MLNYYFSVDGVEMEKIEHQRASSFSVVASSLRVQCFDFHANHESPYVGIWRCLRVLITAAPGVRKSQCLALFSEYSARFGSAKKAESSVFL